MKEKKETERAGQFEVDGALCQMRKALASFLIERVVPLFRRRTAQQHTRNSLAGDLIICCLLAQLYYIFQVTNRFLFLRVSQLMNHLLHLSELMMSVQPAIGQKACRAACTEGNSGVPDVEVCEPPFAC